MRNTPLGIKMDLCNRNMENFIAHLPKCTNEDVCKICGKIKQIKQCQKEE